MQNARRSNLIFLELLYHTNHFFASLYDFVVAAAHCCSIKSSFHLYIQQFIQYLQKNSHHRSRIINFSSGMACRLAVATVAVCFSWRMVLVVAVVVAGTVAVLLVGDWRRCSRERVGSLGELVVVWASVHLGVGSRSRWRGR